MPVQAGWGRAGPGGRSRPSATRAEPAPLVYDDKRMGGTSARILLVEDESAPGRTASTTLQALGHQVHWVRTVREARQELCDGVWDVLVLDVTLDSDGLEFFQAIRFAPEHPGGGVVILTEPGDVQTRERAQQLGAAGVVAKPLVPDRLAAVVQDLVAFI